MPFIIAIALFLGKFQTGHLLEKLSSESTQMQEKCLSLMLPSSTDFVQASLLCGENLSEARWKTALTETSLIHLFIVSGSHLVVLEQILLRLQLPLLLRILVWVFYCLFCGWQPPLVRALMSSLVRILENRFSVSWPRDLSLLIAGLFLLALFPAWIESRSLLMSWAAALALSTTVLWQKRSVIEKFLLLSFAIYVLMLPLLWGFGNLHPLSILYNIFLAIPVTFILWPLSALVIVFPFLQGTFEFCSIVFLHLLEWFSDPVVIETAKPLDIRWLWIYIFALHGALHFARIAVKRKNL